MKLLASDFATAPTMYMVGTGPSGIMNLTQAKTLPNECAMLIAWSYWLNSQSKFTNSNRYYLRNYRAWCLDSGAYTAFTRGKPVSLPGFIDFCKRLMDTEPNLREIFTLDVIGDWKGTKANTEALWKAGIPVIPVFHIGEPWDVLKGYAADYPKIALGGMIPYKMDLRKKFAEQAFARVWPKPIHGLGIGNLDFAQSMPWHSCDSSSWNSGIRLGRWNSFNGQLLCVRRAIDNEPEIRFFLGIERKTRARWEKEMTRFDHLSLLLPLARETYLKQYANTKDQQVTATETSGHGRSRGSHEAVTDSTRPRRKTRSNGEHSTAGS